MSRIGPSILSLLASAAILAISSIGLSRNLERQRPELALDFFPINVEALLNEASGRFAESPTRDDLDGLEKRARRLLSYNPGDARLYSLIGEVERRKGVAGNAFAAFERTLALARTEVHALQSVLLRAVEKGNATEIVDRIDALFRRWPDRIDTYAPSMPQIFAEREGYERLIRRIKEVPPWRSTLISRLAGNEATLPFSAQLVQDLAAGESPPKVADVSNVLNGLINNGQNELAYRTFLLTLSPEQQEAMGYIYNGRFRLAPTGRPFDWQIRSHPGVVFSYPGPGSMDPGLRLEFQQAPVRDVWVRQYLSLPAARYSLSLRARATAASLPKGLFWTIRCVDSNRILARLAMKDGTYRGVDHHVDLTVPPDRCPLQLLHLSTKAIAENWNDRYGGSVTFDDLKIVKKS